MARRLGIRLVQAALLLLALSFLFYCLIGLAPGDPVDLMIAATPGATPEDAARLRALYGADRPLIERYLNWLGAALSGDFGYSRLLSLRVSACLAEPLINTTLLMAASLFLSALFAMPLGIWAALRRGGAFDAALNILALAAAALPVFWTGLVLIIVFSVSLAWLPASGVETVGIGGFWDRLRHLALPAAALGIARYGVYFRHMRSAVVETLRQDWIRTARAKGLSWPRIVTVHALRHAMIPVATLLALDVGAFFSGVLVTETVFGYPGMGKLTYDAVMGNDFNLALAALLLAAALTIFCNLAADAIYGLLDPRIKLQ